MEKHALIFRADMAEAVLRGEKTATRRRMAAGRPRSPWYRHGCAYREGQIFAVNPGRGKPRVAEAEVTAVYESSLGAVRAPQARQEGFRSLLAFREAWAVINGAFVLSERVWVVEFKLSGPFCMGCDGTGWQEGNPACDCEDCFATGIEVSPAGRAFLHEREAVPSQ